MRRAEGYALFDTPIGPCGIAWSPRGIAGVQLPEGSARATQARLRERFPEAGEAAPPPVVRRATERIDALLRGRKSDLSSLALDMEGVPAFHRRVYEVARGIAPGETLTYGEVAKRLGAPGSARAVGQALGRNPFAIVVPCHRVLAAGGRMGGFSAGGGTATKLRLLGIEGAEVALSPAVATAAVVAPAKPRAAKPRGASRAAAPARDARLSFDPRLAVAHLRRSDPALARVIDAVGPLGLELKRTPSLFGALAEAIVYQQLTGKAAATIYGRLCALFPGTRGGPTAEQVRGASDEELRSVGLSRPKILALRDLAERAVAGALPTLAAARRMDDAAIVERLIEVRGIGRWTAEMLLIFRLGRPDVLPVDDYGVRKGLAAVCRRSDLPSRDEVEKRGERWRPYRTAASWYLWRAAERAQARAG